MQNRNANVKYTTVLPAECVAVLKQLVSDKVIMSVNHGIRCAVEQFISQKRKELYYLQMQEASKDKDFVERTMSSQNDFEAVDSVEVAEW